MGIAGPLEENGESGTDGSCGEAGLRDVGREHFEAEVGGDGTC